MESLKDKVDMLSGRVLEPTAPELDATEAKVAFDALCKPLYKSIVRVKQDDLISGQIFGLFSFTPARGASANKHGIFGTAKLRGNFATIEAANDTAELIIRTVDSQNEIYTVKVGQEFPLTKEPKFSAAFESVKLDDQVSEVEKQRHKEDELRNKKERKQLFDREQQLLAENKEILEGKYEEDPLDVYIRARVKRSQLKWTLEDNLRKIEKEVRPAYDAAVKEVLDMQLKDPTLKERYLEKYVQARKEAGIETEFKETGTQTDFIKYLTEED